jgi:hypothetical protein
VNYPVCLEEEKEEERPGGSSPRRHDAGSYSTHVIIMEEVY